MIDACIKMFTGKVTTADLMTSMPFANTVDTVTLKGKTLRAALQHSVNGLEDKEGRFLQFSGE